MMRKMNKIAFCKIKKNQSVKALKEFRSLTQLKRSRSKTKCPINILKKGETQKSILCKILLKINRKKEKMNYNINKLKKSKKSKKKRMIKITKSV